MGARYRSIIERFAVLNMRCGAMASRTFLMTCIRAGPPSLLSSDDEKEEEEEE